MTEYPIVLLPLDEEDGGGYLAAYPDLPGCIADGETPAEALENAQDAFEAWMTVQKERGVEIPPPGASREHLQRKIEALVGAVKALAEANVEASNRIEKLESLLEMAIHQLRENWDQTPPLFLHACLERNGKAADKVH